MPPDYRTLLLSPSGQITENFSHRVVVYVYVYVFMFALSSSVSDPYGKFAINLECLTVTWSGESVEDVSSPHGSLPSS